MGLEGKKRGGSSSVSIRCDWQQQTERVRITFMLQTFGEGGGYAVVLIRVGRVCSGDQHSSTTKMLCI